MRLNPNPLISAGQLQARLPALAEEISRGAAGTPLVVLVVLKGAVIFASDLVRALRVETELEFARARSYRGCESQGLVELTVLPETPLRGRHVLIVEDILDTGRTSVALTDWVRGQGAASVRLCALLDKPSRRATAIAADYTGFVIDDHFVVGYGLDYDEGYRHLPAIHVLEP